MKELFRKQKLVTDSFGVSVDINVDDHLALGEVNEVRVVKVADRKTDYKEVTGATLTLDYEEIDQLIEVLKYASDQLKRSDNQFAK